MENCISCINYEGNKMIELSRERVIEDYKKLKLVAKEYFYKEKYEKALRTIFVAAGYMYTYSQIYVDKELEQIIQLIGQALGVRGTIKQNNKKEVIFYDAFGNDNRGLALIYIRALNNMGYNVKYISYMQFDGTINEIRKILKEEQIILINNRTFVGQIKELNDLVLQTKASKALLYMQPDDVVAATVFSQYKGVLDRFLINLTDHAFWIGNDAFDYTIEFRSYGANLSFQERSIQRDKIFCLPFYPVIMNVEFNGLPFDYENKKIIFSGGALYKTKGMNNLYYRIVEQIIQMDANVVFYYAGEGDTSEIDELIKKYPDKVYYSHERKDFYEVMKRSYLYLSTYPYFGGLMTQYAIMAGKLPITLESRDVIGEQTVETDEIWYFETVDQLLREVRKLISDSKYLLLQEGKLQNTIISSEEYEKELESILENKKQKLCAIRWEEIFTEKVKKIILDRSKWGEYCGYFCRVRAPFLIWKFPVKFIYGFFTNIYSQKIQKKRGK